MTSQNDDEEPVIPLSQCELLYVTLATVTHVLQTRTTYPTNNLLAVIGSYLQARDEYLTATGVEPEVAARYTEAAVEALIEWIEEKDTNESDFQKWAGEMLE